MTAEDIYDWLGFMPRKITRRRMTKWTNRIKAIIRPCDHVWVFQYHGSMAGYSWCNRCRSWLCHSEVVENGHC